MGKLRDLIYSKWNILPDDNTYLKMYNTNLESTNDPRAAWEATEKQWHDGTGHNRFNSYQSFLCFKTRQSKPPGYQRVIRTEFDSKFNFLV
jgi:hypothetical protein